MATLPPLSSEYIAEYSGGKLIAVAATLVPILIIFVALRFYSRYLSKTKYGLDDCLVLISLLLQICMSALAICFVDYGGVGRHFDALEETRPAVTVTYFKYLLAVSFCYFFTVAIPKLAILAFYLRVFSLKHYRIMVYILAGIVVTTGIVCPIMSLNLCDPFAYNWDKTLSGGTCVNENAFYRWGSIPNIITDVAMLILPLPIVWRLHTSINTKIGLTMTFLTGSLGLAFSIVRFTSFFQGSAVIDGTWASVDLMTWTLVEPDVYLIAACLPTYRPLLLNIVQKLRLAQTWSSFTTDKAGTPNRTLKIANSKLGGDGTNTAGFQRLEEGKRSLDRMTLGDQVPLVNINKAHLDRQAPPHGPNQIRIQSDFDVRTSSF